jgi:hypothetical protein
MPGEAKKLRDFLSKITRVTKDSQEMDLIELYRKPGETFLQRGFANVDTGHCAIGHGKNALWTDGTSFCTALAVVGGGKIIVSHNSGGGSAPNREEDYGAEAYLLAQLVAPNQIVLATTPSTAEKAARTDEEARSSSTFVLVQALDEVYGLDKIAGMTTLVTGYDGRAWSQYCVLAASATKGVGIFMGSSAMLEEPSSRTRRASLTPDAPPHLVKERIWQFD